jgi:hypothetical protein
MEGKNNHTDFFLSSYFCPVAVMGLTWMTSIREDEEHARARSTRRHNFHDTEVASSRQQSPTFAIVQIARHTPTPYTPTP